MSSARIRKHRLSRAQHLAACVAVAALTLLPALHPAHLLPPASSPVVSAATGPLALGADTLGCPLCLAAAQARIATPVAPSLPPSRPAAVRVARAPRAPLAPVERVDLDAAPPRAPPA